MSDAPLSEALGAEGYVGDLVADRALAPLTTWRIGGPAEWLATPRDAEDVGRVVRAARQLNLPLHWMGNGSNLLVPDSGVRGVVLRLRKTLDDLRVDGARLTAGAGASFPAVARAAATAGLSGLEFATGIPGTVGGAVAMNAGWHEFETRCTLRRVTGLADGEPRSWTADACDLGYRHSRFRSRDEIVLSAEFELEPDAPERVLARIDEFTASRKTNQPTDRPSCGSVFLKPPGDFAGRLIDEAGLKGARAGGIQVSELHANFFVNEGGGTARDVLELVGRVEQEVERRFGVRLIREFVDWSDAARQKPLRT